MIDARITNHTETLLQIEKLNTSIEQLERNLYIQIPQGLYDEFISSKNTLLNCVEDIQINLLDYIK